MKKICFAGLAAAALMATTTFSTATTVGFEDPSWGVDSVIWDVFGSVPGMSGGSRTFASPTELGGGNGYLKLTAGTPFAPGSGFPSMQLVPGATLIAGDGIYTGGVTNAWSIFARAATTITTMTLQIKEFTNEQTVGDISSYFSPTVLGISPVDVTATTGLVEGTGEDAMSYNIVTFTWEELNIGPGTDFAMSFSGAGEAHRAMDGFRLDTDGALSIPEPSTYALLGLSLGACIWMARRRGALQRA